MRIYHTVFFSHCLFLTLSFSHTDLKDLKDGYAVRYAVMLRDLKDFFSHGS